jgi:adenylate cyclase
MRITFGWPLLADDDLTRCLEIAERVIELGPDDAGTLCRCGLTLQLVGQDYDRGFEVVERALSMNPHDPVALVYGGITHFLSGDLDRGAMLMRQVIAVEPHQSFEAMGVLACLLAASGQHTEALDWARRGLAINPHYAPNHWVAVASAAHLGQLAEAKQALNRLLALTPDLTVQRLLRVRPRDLRRDEVLAEGFRKAGLREI